MFTREDTRAVKGLAVLLMLFHHLAYAQSRWPAGFAGFASPLWPGFVEDGYLTDLARNALVCVSIFFFLGGYGLYRRWEGGGFRLASAVRRLYRQYWRVFFVFVPIAFLLFARTGEGLNPLCTRYVITDARAFLRDLLANLTGYDSSFNSEWWFFGYYLCALALGLAFCLATRGHRHYLPDALLVFAIDLCSQHAMPWLTGALGMSSLKGTFLYTHLLNLNVYSLSLFMGVVCAKYGLLEKLKAWIGGFALPGLLSAAGCAVALLFRAYAANGAVDLDLILVPFLVACASALLDRAGPAKACLRFLGRHSGNMWLIHSFYCYYFLELTYVVYCTQSVWIDYLILVALSLGSSMLLELFYAGLGRAWAAVRGRLGLRAAEG